MAYSRLRLLVELSADAGFNSPEQVAVSESFITTEPARKDRVLATAAGLNYSLEHMTTVQFLVIYNEHATENLTVEYTNTTGANTEIIPALQYTVLGDVDPTVVLVLTSADPDGGYAIILAGGT